MIFCLNFGHFCKFVIQKKWTYSKKFCWPNKPLGISCVADYVFSFIFSSQNLQNKIVVKISNNVLVFARWWMWFFQCQKGSEISDLNRDLRKNSKRDEALIDANRKNVDLENTVETLTMELSATRLDPEAKGIFKNFIRQN